MCGINLEIVISVLFLSRKPNCELKSILFLFKKFVVIAYINAFFKKI